MFDLLKTHTVHLIKKSTEGGYLNNNHEWVTADEVTSVDLHCNIQPFNTAKSKIILPDGVRTDDIIVLRTRTQLTIADHYKEEEGSLIEYKGIRYEIFMEKDWSSYGLASDHFEYLFKRQDES